MKKSFPLAMLFVMIIALVLGACSNWTVGLPKIVRGSGNVITSTRDVSDFDEIVIEGAGEITLTCCSTESLQIEAEDNILPEITSEVKNGELTIGYDSKFWDDRVIPTETIKYTISIDNLEKLTVNGAVRLVSDALTTDSFDLIINGAGEFTFTKFKAEDLKVVVSGGASVSLSGEATLQDVEVNGAGNYDAADLMTSSTKFTFNGAGNAELWAEDTLEIAINGAGSVEYYGMPQVTQSISGLGSIKHMGDK